MAMMFLRTFWAFLRQAFRRLTMAGDPTKAAFDSRYEIDQILAIRTGTITGIASGTTGSITIDTTSIVQPWTCLYQGIWSIDGTNWYDINGEILHPGTFVSDWSSSISSNYGTLALSFSNIRSGVTSDVQYKVAIISEGCFQPDVYPEPIDQTQKLDSRYSYQKIFNSNTTGPFKNVEPFTVAPNTTFTQTVNHNFGYVPSARGFMEIRDVGGTFTFQGVYDMTRSGFSYNFASGGNNCSITGSITADTSNVYFNITNTTTGGSGRTATMALFYRVYYDF